MIGDALYKLAETHIFAQVVPEYNGTPPLPSVDKNRSIMLFISVGIISCIVLLVVFWLLKRRHSH